MAARALPAHNAPLSKSSSPPNQTLYVKNLPEKLRKRDLQLSLYTLFTTYGTVLDVVAMPGDKMRGQAWIAFRDVQASTQAMRSLQGFEFFGKQMKIQYAKGKSDAIAKLDGTYRMPSVTVQAAAPTDLQQQIFGGPPSKLSGQQAWGAQVDGKLPGEQNDELKGKKRQREEDGEDSSSMEEDSDAPMEEASDEE